MANIRYIEIIFSTARVLDTELAAEIESAPKENVEQRIKRWWMRQSVDSGDYQIANPLLHKMQDKEPDSLGFTTIPVGVGAHRNQLTHNAGPILG